MQLLGELLRADGESSMALQPRFMAIDKQPGMAAEYFGTGILSR